MKHWPVIVVTVAFIVGASVVWVAQIGAQPPAVPLIVGDPGPGSDIPANPDGTPVNPEGGQCNLVDFEGVGHNQPVGTVTGIPEVGFAPSWLGCIDLDAGGNCDIANEPSPDTIAYFTGAPGPINFDTSVGYVELYYSIWQAGLPFDVVLWDGANGTGNAVASATGNTVGYSPDGAQCSGDPNGLFCLFAFISVTAPQGNALSMTIEAPAAASGAMAVDDVLACIGTPVPSLPSVYWILGLAFTLLVGAGILLRGRSIRRFV